MRKLHWISLALIATPVVLMHACGGDDSTPGGAAGSGGSGTAGSPGTGGNAGATGTAGKAGAGGSSAGSAGSAGSGTAGSTTEGGAGTGGSGSTEGGDAPKVDAPTSDAPVVTNDAPVSDAPVTSDANAVCADDASLGVGDNCNHFCETFLSVCNAVVDDGGMHFGNKGACMSECNSWNQSQQCCRFYHVQNAFKGTLDGGVASDVQTHCPHALGRNGVCVN